jgi:MoaA/NifB/PqqE/SkfB family radical SAM enzyme
MPFELFKKLVYHLTFYLRVGLNNAGESMLHPCFSDMVKYCHKKHFRDLVVYSNGTLEYPEGVRVFCFPKPPKVVLSSDFKIESSEVKLKKINSYCHHLFRCMVVLWNGDVVPCCHDVAGLKIVGNVKDSSLYEVWHNQKYALLRKQGFCENCELWAFIR